MTRPVRHAAATALALALTALAAGPASAASIRLGSTAASAGNFQQPDVVACDSGVQAGSDDASPTYTAPGAGTLTAWRVQGMTQTLGGRFWDSTVQLQVYRPSGGSSWTLIAETPPQTAKARQLNTYAVSIPVRAGDVLGLVSTIGCSFTSDFIADSVRTFGFHPTIGTAAAPAGLNLSFGLLNVSATEELAPVGGGGGGCRHHCGDDDDDVAAPSHVDSKPQVKPRSKGHGKHGHGRHGRRHKSRKS